ncbi:SDR family NAD(P)-dependent oxidoreductase [Streptantibioticus rubrisoli]|uniref:SDR family oxidoreductase n=1 Tax=Streptantibioticus rubrisoli TaxID=1387313 RepID=A0ABT1PEA5_9ACTN|nr:SDR family oxidoreductase [Streptantibioticus rubrisoli]MCQ4042660.1 SDR family oxidoreductase [Streptantibioticus rubrisoli]
MATRKSPLNGLSALVTGGSRGLGLLIARELVGRGCRLLICARDADELRRAEEELRAMGGQVYSVVADLTDTETPDRLVAVAEEKCGQVDVLVNNAGIIQVGPMETMTEQDFREAMEVMFFAQLRMALAVLPGMRSRGTGRIVNITSVGGRIAVPHLLPYAAAKFAATGFSDGLRAELAPAGISVTTVIPGLMRTGSHFAARFGGKAEQEYAWFASGAGMPVLSMNAERAARAIVRAAERGRPEVILTPAAKAAVRLHGVAPATTVRMLSLVDRLLPSAGNGTGPVRDVSGVDACERLDSRLVDRVTSLANRAARRNNEPVPAKLGG